MSDDLQPDLLKPAAPEPQLSLIEMLRRKYPSPEWAFMQEVAPRPIGGRYADVVAVNLWSSRGYAIHGFELKVSRSDWLRELKQPEKAEPIFRYCVAPSTKVLTEDLRWVEAGDLKVGDPVIGFDEEISNGRSRRWRIANVTALSFERRQAFRVALENGKSIVCTGDHEWIAASGEVGHWDPVFWISTEKIMARLRRRNCRIFFPRYMNPWPEKSDYSMGFLAAAFDGEGSLPRPDSNWRLVFAQKDNAMLATVRAFLTENGWAHNVYEHESNRGVRILYMVGGFQEVMRFLGQARPPRLLELFKNNFGGDAREMRTKQRDRVLSVEPCGESEVAVLSTSTGTFIAEGYGSHNCDFWCVVTEKNVVKDGELPPTWGHLERRGNGLGIVKAPPKLQATPVTREFFASLMRRGHEQIEQIAERAYREKLQEAHRDVRQQVARAVEHSTNEHKELKAMVAKFSAETGIVFERYSGPSIATIKLAQRLEALDGWRGKGALSKLSELASDLERCAVHVREALQKTELEGPTR